MPESQLTYLILLLLGLVLLITFLIVLRQGNESRQRVGTRPSKKISQPSQPKTPQSSQPNISQLPQQKMPQPAQLKAQNKGLALFEKERQRLLQTKARRELARTLNCPPYVLVALLRERAIQLYQQQLGCQYQEACRDIDELTRSIS